MGGEHTVGLRLRMEPFLIEGDPALEDGQPEIKETFFFRTNEGIVKFMVRARMEVLPASISVSETKEYIASEVPARAPGSKEVRRDWLKRELAYYRRNGVKITP